MEDKEEETEMDVLGDSISQVNRQTDTGNMGEQEVCILYLQLLPLKMQPVY